MQLVDAVACYATFAHRKPVYVIIYSLSSSEINLTKVSLMKNVCFQTNKPGSGPILDCGYEDYSLRKVICSNQTKTRNLKKLER